MEPKGPNIDQKGAERGPKHIEKFPPGPGRSPPAERVELGYQSCVFPSRMHPFPAVGLVFAVFFFFLGGFHPGSLPFPPLSVVFWSPLGPPLVESGLSCFRYVFWECFLTIFDAFLTSFGGYFYMFFAYLFKLCFCLLFPRMFFKCMHTFQTRDLQNTLFFSSKNVILEEPHLQNKFENLDFWGWDRALFFA